MADHAGRVRVEDSPKRVRTYLGGVLVVADLTGPLAAADERPPQFTAAVEHRRQPGRIDFARSEAWALVDHQFSHVFVRDADPRVITEVSELFGGREGVAQVMVAEERRLLFVRGREVADRQEVYDRWYSMERLRKRADNRFFEDTHSDLWEGLKQTFRLFEDTAHASQLGLTALDGELFGRFACADLIDTRNEAGPMLRNDQLLSAIWHLSTFEDAVGHGAGKEEGGRICRGEKGRIDGDRLPQPLYGLMPQGPGVQSRLAQADDLLSHPLSSELHLRHTYPCGPN